MANETILIVDDDKEIRDLIHIYLQNEGYNTIRAANGMEALSLMQRHEVDLIILDIMMPGMDGIQTCIKIREVKDMPIIMLSAKSEDIDKILGLTTGADDYISKPFNPLELLARVKSQLRRYMKQNSALAKREEIIEIDELIINVNTHEVSVDGKEIKLTPREFGILEFLARNSGMVFSMEKIYTQVWNEQAYESNNAVMVHIRNLREKIEENPRKPRYIKTVWGVGYKLAK